MNALRFDNVATTSRPGPLMSDADAEDLIADRQPFTTGKAAYRGGVRASTSPPKERYAVSNDTVVKLIQPGILTGRLTEVLRDGARAL